MQHGIRPGSVGTPENGLVGASGFSRARKGVSSESRFPGARRPLREPKVLLKPGRAAEMHVLLGPQPVGESAGGQLHGVVREHLILGDSAQGAASTRKAA